MGDGLGGLEQEPVARIQHDTADHLVAGVRAVRESAAVVFEPLPCLVFGLRAVPGTERHADALIDGMLHAPLDTASRGGL